MLDEGWLVVVICHTHPEKRGYNWYGEWSMRCRSPDQTRELFLITARNEMEFRVFKTANAVISLLHDHGFSYASIPLVPGGIQVHSLK